MKNGNKWLAVVGVALAALILLAVGLGIGSYTRSSGYYGHHMGGMMGGFFRPAAGMHSFGGGVLGVVFWVAVIGGLSVLAAILAGRNGKPAIDSEHPLDIARRRFAQGEIDQEEFEQIKEALSE